MLVSPKLVNYVKSSLLLIQIIHLIKSYIKTNKLL